MLYTVNKTSISDYRDCDTKEEVLASKPCDEAELIEYVEHGDGRFPPITYKWGIHIDTLEALNDFIQRNGKCVITTSNNIEIYDTWRE